MAEARLFEAADDRRELPPGVVAQAIEWVTMLQSGVAAADADEACRRWRAQHPDHELAWTRLERLRGDVRSGVGGAPAPMARGVLVQSARASRRRAVKWMVGACGIGAAGLLASGRVPLEGPVLAADYRTGIGERRRVVLPDGSRLTLNTGSAVDIDFGDALRLVALRRGEIHLDTSADPRGRPLVVRTGGGDVQPLGTRFAVRRFDGGTVRVAVRSGAVALRRTGDGADAAGPTLKAGEQGGFDARDWLARAPVADLCDSWVSGALVVERMALPDFLDELGRYRRGLLRCDPDVAHLKVSGAFPLADTDAALAALATVLPVTVRRRTPYWVTLGAA